MEEKRVEGWYCARTKPKHEHIAAANLEKQLSLEVFLPRLRVERVTRRGVVCSTDPLFPCYLFIRCQPEMFGSIRYVAGVSSLVNFGGVIPAVPDAVVCDLRACFESGQPLSVESRLLPGAEVAIAEGAFRGLAGVVLRMLPSRQRVELLLDILGRQTVVEVDRHMVYAEKNDLFAGLPALALPARRQAGCGLVSGN